MRKIDWEKDYKADDGSMVSVFILGPSDRPDGPHERRLKIDAIDFSVEIPIIDVVAAYAAVVANNP